MTLNPTFLKLIKAPALLAIISFVLYWVMAYDLERTNTLKLLSIYTTVFLLFYLLIQYTKHNLKLLTWLAFGFRAIFILAIPNLSQDFYRFIWDGRMILEGFNPYLYTPESFITSNQFPVAQAQELYNGMGELNGSHFTNYPPLNQLCFAIAALFASKSILYSATVMRLIIIAADFGTLYFGKKLLKKLNLSEHNIFWYILNPFIIIELTGNLHFEGVMIFFLIWSLYLLHSGKWKWAAVILACSISVKLIPLMFLPLFYQWFVKNDSSLKSGIVRLLSFYSIVGGSILILFLPFFDTQFISNYSKTVGLWFNNFEFNASIYYLAREIGYLFRGYNEIAVIGKILPVIVILYILIVTFFRKNKSTRQLISAMLFTISIYLFFSTTVHPWYIAMPLVLAVFTNYKFPILWSLAVVLSYLAYTNKDNTENLWVIAIEYCIVYAYFIYEVRFKKSGLATNQLQG
ncbi:mannosyltransferase [Winogradskyella sp. 3972H.M.0a.05]|uniref:mannosyltransferase n=1 Tax=Winogradskyella sp. 3972H.M.0a.05 TaxID=2950277 RepID=UPI00339A0141